MTGGPPCCVAFSHESTDTGSVGEEFAAADALASSHESTDAGSVGGEYVRGPAEMGAGAFVRTQGSEMLGVIGHRRGTRRCCSLDMGVSRTIRQRQALAMQPDVGHALVLSDNYRYFPSHDAAIGEVYVIGSVGDDERQLAIAPVCHLDGVCVVQIRGPCGAHGFLLAIRFDDRSEGAWLVSLLGLGEARTSVSSTSGTRTS